eukprot:scaffold8319_cov211-Ochromonas_danica.AAC.4
MAATGSSSIAKRQPERGSDGSDRGDVVSVTVIGSEREGSGGVDQWAAACKEFFSYFFFFSLIDDNCDDTDTHSQSHSHTTATASTRSASPSQGTKLSSLLLDSVLAEHSF